MQKIAMYLRKSRAEFNDPEDTLSRHKSILLEMAAKNGWDIPEDHIYHEVVSGSTLYARPEMLRLLQDVESGMYDAVLCMDIDRLGRSAMSEQGIILETFQAAGCKIITPAKTYDLNNEIDEQYTELASFMARQELKLISRRMRRGLERTVQEGGYISNPPYGYRRVTVGNLPSLEPVPEEADMVRMMFDMYVNQGIGCTTIAATLNRMGAVPRRGGPFNRSTVSVILKNPVYCGKIARNKTSGRAKTRNGKKCAVYHPQTDWELFDGIHPPIIEQSLYDKAQELFAQRYHPSYSKGHAANPLAGLIVCGNCGKKIQLRRMGNKSKIVYLLCPTTGCCSATPFEDVEKLLLASIRISLIRIKAVCAQEIPPAVDYKASIKATTVELEKVERQIDRLRDLLEQGVYTVAVYQERMAVLTQRISGLKEQIAEFERLEKQQEERQLEPIIQRIENALEAYGKTDDIAEKNYLLKSIVDSAVYRIGPEKNLGLEVHLKYCDDIFLR